MNRYKIIVMLHYFHSLKSGFSFSEITEIMGFQIEQLNSALDFLVDKGYLEYDEIYKVSSKGKALLDLYGLLDVDFYEELVEEETEIFTKKSIEINDIYIPKKKFKYKRN